MAVLCLYANKHLHNEVVFCHRAKTLPHDGVPTGWHYFSKFLLSVCPCACVTFVVFTDCESCTRPISTNAGSMEAGEYGLTRGTYIVACRLEVVAVTGLL